MSVCAKWLLVSNGGAGSGNHSLTLAGIPHRGFASSADPSHCPSVAFPSMSWSKSEQELLTQQHPLSEMNWEASVALEREPVLQNVLPCLPGESLSQKKKKKWKMLLNLPHNLNILMLTVRFVATLKDVAPCSLHRGHRGRWWVGCAGSCLLAKGRSGHPGHNWLGTGFFPVNRQHLRIQDKS